MIEFVAANENRRNIKVRRVLRPDGNLDGDAPAAALDHLPGVKSVALGRHQYRGWLFAGDDQHVRGLTRLISLLVGNDLYALLRRAAPPAAFARSPEERGRFDVALLGRGRRHAHPKFAGVRNRQLDLRLAAGIRLALRRGDHRPRAFAPVPAIHLHLKRRLHRLLVVVLRGDGDGRGAALAVDIGVRLGRQEEAAVSGEREAVAGDFAIARISDARFDAIDQVLLLAVDARRHRDLQLAVRVERAALLRLLIAAVTIVILRVGVVALIAGVRLVFIFVATHRPVG